MSFTRNKDKKVEVSFTNWVLGGSLVSLTSTASTDSSRLRSGAKRVIVTELESDDDAVLFKSPKSQKADKKEIDKEKSKDPEQDGKGERKDRYKDKGEKTEKCGKCGKKVVPCKEGCKGGDDKSKSKSESKGDGKRDRGEKSDTEAKNGGGGDGGGSGSGWTEQQDAKIKEMKGENKSWKDIALKVGASKKDVQNRYKELMKGGDGGQNKSDEKKDEGGWETSGGSSWGADDGGVMGGGNMPDFGALFVDEAEDGGDEQSEGEGLWQEKNSTNGNGGGKSGGGGKKQKQKGNKQQNGNHNQQSNNGGGGSGYGNPFDDPPEQAPTGKLRPDGAWTQDDCEILEYLKNKYEENKWLHMQAGFYNWTGRMVIAQLIEQKFKDDGAD